MKEVELKIEQARKQVKLAKSQFYPNFSLIFNYERQGDKYDVRGSDFQDAETWKVIAAMEWTFWEWGKTYYSVNESKVRLIQAEDALIQTRDAVTLEVKEAYLNLKEAEKNIFVAQTAIKQAEENFRMNKERYKEQEATTTEVMDAQTLLTQAQTNYYNALSDYNIARARLERAMGLER
jgi:outer membrane protein TolC